MLLKEIQKAQDVLNKIKEMRSGTLGSALIQIQNEVYTINIPFYYIKQLNLYHYL